MRVLILGVSGMLGNAMIKVFSEDNQFVVYGTSRSNVSNHFFSTISEKIISGIDVNDNDALVEIMASVKPDIIINCIGLIKQLSDSNDPLVVLPLNSILPHRLSKLAEMIGARYIHISTDCVFSGTKGNYRESDRSDAIDLYGTSKYLGEVNYNNSVTLRTSIIGHELVSSYGLVEWFLSQKDSCLGYENAIFSGLPTVVLARIIRDIVIPREMKGLFHVASHPISKFNLLKIIAEVYRKDIKIIPDRELKINRSLSFEKFSMETGYKPDSWFDLISTMHKYQLLD